MDAMRRYCQLYDNAYRYESQDESDEGSRDEGKVPDLPHELFARLNRGPGTKCVLSSHDFFSRDITPLVIPMSLTKYLFW